MAEASIRDLRNHGGDIVDRVVAGESITVTRSGKPVAELRPLPRGRVTAVAVVQRFKRLPRIEVERFRADIDAVVDQSL